MDFPLDTVINHDTPPRLELVRRQVGTQYKAIYAKSE